MNYLYKALVDFPAFDIFAGRTYTLENMTPDQKSLKDVGTVFCKTRDTTNDIQVDAYYKITGVLVNLKMSKRNNHCVPGTHILGERVRDLIVHVTGVSNTPMFGTDVYAVLVTGMDGTRYTAYVPSTDIRDLNTPNTRTKYGVTMIPGVVYFFISSKGSICRTVYDRDKAADEFRMKTGNCFDTHDKAHMVYKAIMQGFGGVANAVDAVLKEGEEEKTKTKL